ncbi:BON domain-containing protein [Alsobacter sp. SYSU BS001988]
MAYEDRFRDPDRKRWTEDRYGSDRNRMSGSGSPFGGGSGGADRDRNQRYGQGGRNQTWERAGDWGRDETGRGDDWGGSRGADRERDRGWHGGSRNEGPVAPEYGPTRGASSYSAGGEDRYGFGGGYGRSGYGDRDRGYRGGGYGGREQGSDWGSSSWESSSGGRGYEGRSDRYSDRDRNERGFFDRASDEVASWFGDDEAERRRRQDAAQEQSHHRGRGPRGYSRSDDRIREDVNDRLTDDPHIDASDIEVVVQNGEVTLSGNVNERFAKRHAEDIAESVSGVTHVQNNIRVKRQESGQHAGGSGYGSNPSDNASIYSANAGSGGSMTSGSAATGGSASATGTGADATGASSTGSSGANLASGGSSRKTGRTA